MRPAPRVRVDRPRDYPHNCRLSTAHCPLSTVHCPLFTARCPLSKASRSSTKGIKRIKRINKSPRRLLSPPPELRTPLSQSPLPARIPFSPLPNYLLPSPPGRGAGGEGGRYRYFRITGTPSASAANCPPPTASFDYAPVFPKPSTTLFQIAPRPPPQPPAPTSLEIFQVRNISGRSQRPCTLGPWHHIQSRRPMLRKCGSYEPFRSHRFPSASAVVVEAFRRPLTPTSERTNWIAGRRSAVPLTPGPAHGGRGEKMM